MYIWGYMFVIVELMGKIKNTNRKEKPLDAHTEHLLKMERKENFIREMLKDEDMKKYFLNREER